MKHKSIFCLFLCICLFITACGIKEGDFTKESVKLSEARHSTLCGYGSNKTMELIERNGVTYAFEPGIELKERSACIGATEKLIEKLGVNKSLQINIYKAESYDCNYVTDGSVFTYLQDWKSPEYIASVLYGLFGEYCNTGLVTGYANYLCQELYRSSVETCSEDWTYTGELNALDLNLLCFRPEFVSETDIQSVTKIANTFVSDYIRQNGEVELQSLLTKSGDPATADEVAVVLSGYYANMNIAYTPSDILYRFGGKSFDYVAKSKYATMYVDKEWYDVNQDVSPLTYDGFLHQNYNDTKQFFMINTEQMENYQKLFNLGSYNNDLTVYFTNSYARTSVYMGKYHAICVTHVVSFMHEYVHALTSEKSIMEAWAQEGFARYFCHEYDMYGIAMMTADLNIQRTDQANQYVEEYRAAVGRDLDSEIDLHKLQDLVVYSRSYDDPNDDGGYDVGASFVGYLVSVMGAEKVIDIVCNTHDFGKYNYDELVADWNQYIVENYSGYSKIK